MPFVNVYWLYVSAIEYGMMMMIIIVVTLWAIATTISRGITISILMCYIWHLIMH